MKVNSLTRQMTTLNSRPHLGSFIWINQVILFTGMGLFPVLPVYAGAFGADPRQAGIFLALVYLAISSGTLVSGWLAQRFGRFNTYLTAGLLGLPALVALAYANTLWQATLLVSLVWFTGGIGLSFNNVYLGLITDPERRGRTFGWMALTGPLGAIAGGMTVSRLVASGGFPLVFSLMAVVWASWPLVAWLTIPRHVEAVSAKESSGGGTRTAASPANVQSVFARLLAAAFLTALTVSVGRMGLSLAMKDQGFSLSAISDANVMAGLLTLPAAWGAGRLADRLGRKPMLMITFALAGGGMLLLSLAANLSMFWLANGMLVAAYSLNSNMTAAYAADLLPPSELGRRMPLVNGSTWIAGVVGFAGSGFMIEGLGLYAAFQAISLLAVVAAALTGLPGLSPATPRPEQPQEIFDCPPEESLEACM